MDDELKNFFGQKMKTRCNCFHFDFIRKILFLSQNSRNTPFVSLDELISKTLINHSKNKFSSVAYGLKSQKEIYSILRHISKLVQLYDAITFWVYSALKTDVEPYQTSRKKCRNKCNWQLLHPKSFRLQTNSHKN